MERSYLYTKRGDAGETDMYTGQRVSKDDSVFNALGSVDRLNVSLGSIISEMGILFFVTESIILFFKTRRFKWKYQYTYIKKLQNLCLTMGSSVGSDYHGIKSKSKIHFPGDAVGCLEKRIDFLTYCLPKLTTFILPEGNIACRAHEARVTTRDLERKLVKFNKKRLDLVEEIRFSNRLSDYLFELSRYIHIIETCTNYLYIILILCVYIPCC